MSTKQPFAQPNDMIEEVYEKQSNGTWKYSKTIVISRNGQRREHLANADSFPASHYPEETDKVSSSPEN